MKVPVAGCILIESITVCDMYIGVSQCQICRPDIRGRYRKSQERVLAWRNAAFFNAAEGSWQRFIPHYPVLQESLLIDNEVWSASDDGMGFCAAENQVTRSC